MAETDIAAALRSFLPEDCVLSREEERRPYECDALTVFRQLPGLVVLPRTEQQLHQVLLTCSRLGVPVVALLGPTDHRWSTVPGRAPQTILTADPTLPEAQSANDHPDRCRIDRIELAAVAKACDGLLGTEAGTVHSGSLPA